MKAEGADAAAIEAILQAAAADEIQRAIEGSMFSSFERVDVETERLVEAEAESAE